MVLALPRGGVSWPRRSRLRSMPPLISSWYVRFGVPFQPELAMGAVVDGAAPIIVRNEEIIELAGIDEPTFDAVCEKELGEIERRRKRYLGTRERIELAGRTVILIDDGIATGATTRAALRAIRLREPKRLILAVPVAPTESLKGLREDADKVICLEDPESFSAIGFTMQTSDKSRTRRWWMCLHGLRLVRRRSDSRSDTANFVNPWRPNAYVRRRGKIQVRKVAVLFLLVITPAWARIPTVRSEGNLPGCSSPARARCRSLREMHDGEPAARAELQRRGTSFGSKERRLCISSTRIGGGRQAM